MDPDRQEKHEAFTYTYSARQQEEIRRIRAKYLPPAENPLDRLRRLDRAAARRGTAAAVLTGTAGALALGVGMCCTMVWTQFFSLGMAVGLAGIAAMAAALPLYRRITRRDREKLAPQILQLTEELGAGPAGGRPAGENSSPG